MVAKVQTSSNPEPLRILFIGEDPSARDEVTGHLCAGLESPVFEILTSMGELECLSTERMFSICIVHHGRRIDFVEVLEQMRRRQPGCPVLLLLEQEQESLAVEALDHSIGAYIVKTPQYGSRLCAATAALARSAAIRDESSRDLEQGGWHLEGVADSSIQGILIETNGTPVFADAALPRMLEYDSADHVLRLRSMYEFVDVRERPRVRLFAERRLAGLEATNSIVFRARRQGGTLIWLEDRVDVVAWKGRPALQHIVVDVSARRRARNALRLAAKVASEAGKRDDFASAIRAALRWLARGMGWEIAESWVPSTDGEFLEAGPCWCHSAKRDERFLVDAGKRRFKPGEGLAGRVWATGQPEWIDDVSNAGGAFQRSILANDAGLKGGCAIPIGAHGRTVAVLCFYSSESHAENGELIAALAAGTASLGPVLLRIQAEQSRQASIEQTETLISRNADGILVVDDQDNILFANPAAEQTFGRGSDGLKGMPFGMPTVHKGVAEIEIHNAGTASTRLNEMRVADINWRGRPARLVSLRDVTERHESKMSLERHKAALQERVKELRCVYTVSALLADQNLEWSQVLQQVVNAIPNGWQFPENTCARLEVEDTEVSTAPFMETAWRLFSTIEVEEEVAGSVEVFYLEERPRSDVGPFLKEEVSLLNEMAMRIAQAVSSRRHRQALAYSRRRFQDFAEAASDWLWEMDENLRFTYFSRRIEAVMQQPVDHWIGRTRDELTGEAAATDQKWIGHRADLEARRPFKHFRYQVALPGGQTKHIVVSGVPVFDENGRFAGYRGTGTDETLEVEARDLARESEFRLQGVADRLPGVVFQRLRKPDGSLEYPYLSAGASTILGYEPDEIKQDPLLLMDKIHPEDRPRFDVSVAETSRTLEPMDMKFRMFTRSGDERWLWHRSRPRRLENGDTIWDCIELDITEQKKTEARVQYLGHHDLLTGLPNHSLFVERVNQILPIASRNRQNVAIGMLGLKRFKRVNEEFGMSGGDEVLREVASRFKDCLRPGDTVARLGGDRFLFLLPTVGRDTGTHIPFERLLKAMEQPFRVSRHQILLAFNMGVAVFPDDGDNAEQLIQKADTAQGHYNRWGPGFGYAFYQDRMPASGASILSLEKDLRDAIESDQQLGPFFQPIYSARSGRLVGVETLARWKHPERGMVPPSEFIALAEDTALIIPLGLKILRQACIHAYQWERAGLPRIMVTVNLAAAQIRDPELTRSVKDVLEETGMTPERLVLEVTEGTLIGDLKRAAEIMEEFVALGVNFALDDFGVGYSSLSYLARLPVQALKIDRSFTRDADSDVRNEATIKAIVALARALNLHVVAEGIETEGQLAHMQRLGCDTLQGFLLGRPMPPGEVETLLGRCEPFQGFSKPDIIASRK